VSGGTTATGVRALRGGHPADPKWRQPAEAAFDLFERVCGLAVPA